MSEKTATGWILPAVIGMVIGAAATGGPLFHTLATVTDQLQQMEAERATMQQQMFEQQKLAQELARPDLPIQLSVRQGFIDAGYVLTIRNVSARELVVNAKFSGAGGAEQVRRIVVPANAAREVGESEGWAFSSQDSIALTNPDYRDLVYTIPSR